MKNKKDKASASREEQERTTIKKKLFLELCEKSRGNITMTCTKVEIYRDTYYKWCQSDPEFKRQVEQLRRSRYEVLEDVGMNLALGGDVPAWKEMLRLLHPAHKKKGGRSDVHHYFHKLEPAGAEKPKSIVDMLQEEPSSLKENEEIEKEILGREQELGLDS